MMKVLLTGSAGFIGTNFINLYKDVYDIIEIDRKTGKEVVSIDLSDCIGVKHIVHLAAVSGIQACEDDKKQAIKDNIMAVEHIKYLSMDLNIPVTFASSQAAKDGTNTYSFTKMVGEETLLSGVKSACILRLSNVYGGLNYLETKTSVVSKFINAVRNEEPIFVTGDGTQTRDFIHVDDICEAIHKSIQLEEKSNMILDIGTGVKTSIWDLAKMISPESILYYKNYVNIGVESNVADTSEAEKILGFKAEKTLKEYLKSVK